MPNEVVIPFINTVAEDSRPSVESFIANINATSEELAGYESLDDFLAEYKPKIPQAQPADWTASLDVEHKAIVGTKGWKAPGDVIKGYHELEKLVGHEKIAMPKKDKDGNYLPGEFERVMEQLGCPKDAKGYKTSADFKLPEGMKIDETMLADFNAKLHKAGFLPHQYALTMSEFSNFLSRTMQSHKEANEKAFNESTLNLRTKWGSAYEAKAKLANDVLRNFADTKEGEAIAKKYGNDPAIIEILANIGNNLSEESLSRVKMSGMLFSPAEAQLQVETIEREHRTELLNAHDPQHKYWVDKRESLMRMTIA